MTRDEVSEKIKLVLRDLRPDDGRPEYEQLSYTALRPSVVFPGMLRFVLCELMGFKCDWWPWEKVRWQVKAVFRGQPVAFEDRKMGFAIIVPDEMDQGVRDDLVKRLLGAMHILTNFLRAVSKSKVEDGQFTILNRFHEHEGRYRYFRDQARRSYATPPPPPAHGTSADGMVTWTKQDIYKPEREGGYNTVAMVHEFFSRLEHILILVLPSIPSFDPAKGRLRQLMSANWQDKYRAAFDLSREHIAKGLFERLLELKEELRNPKAHGGFLKDGASALFHMEGIGALPMDLLDYEFDRGLIPTPRYEDICGLFDEVDGYLDAHPRIKFGMLAAKMSSDVKFDPESLKEYREAITRSESAGTMTPFEQYLRTEEYAHDRYVNYEG